MTGLSILLLAPAVLQGILILVDEGWFHRRRGLPRWERIGHPLDTLTAAACIGWLAVHRPGGEALAVYAGLAFFSSVFVTKDSFVHSSLCSAGENMAHSILYVLHPIVFLGFGLLWLSGRDLWAVRVQLALTIAYAAYQFVFWNLVWDPKSLSGG